MLVAANDPTKHEERSFDLRVPGATLHVVTVGPDGALPLIAVHGGPGDAHDCLRPFLDRLASEQVRVVYYDQRGGGRSALDPGEQPAGVSGHVDDIESIRRHFGAERVGLLGFSWGALLALLYAIERPERVSRLVLVSPTSVRSLSGGAPSAALAAAASRPEVSALVAQLDHAAKGADGADAARRARFAIKIAPWLAHPARALDITPVETNEDVASAATRSLGAFDLRPKLAALRGVPSVVIRGACDPLPEAPMAETASCLGARLVVLPGSGHAPFAEVPEAFAAAALGLSDDGGPPARELEPTGAR